MSTTTQYHEGQRVMVTNDPYARFNGEYGTVVPIPPEIARQPRMAAGLEGTVWVRMDSQDARVPAIGWDADEITAICGASLTVPADRFTPARTWTCEIEPGTPHGEHEGYTDAAGCTLIHTWPNADVLTPPAHLTDVFATIPGADGGPAPM